MVKKCTGKAWVSHEPEVLRFERYGRSNFFFNDVDGHISFFFGVSMACLIVNILFFSNFRKDERETALMNFLDRGMRE